MSYILIFYFYFVSFIKTGHIFILNVAIKFIYVYVQLIVQ